MKYIYIFHQHHDNVPKQLNNLIFTYFCSNSKMIVRQRSVCHPSNRLLSNINS